MSAVFTTQKRTVSRRVRAGVEMTLAELFDYLGTVDVYAEDEESGDSQDVTLRYDGDWAHEADQFTVTVPAGKGRKTVSLDDIIIKVEFAEGNGPDDEEDDC